jgi:hypothetical protein
MEEKDELKFPKLHIYHPHKVASRKKYIWEK